MDRVTERARGGKGIITALAGVAVLLCITLLAPGQAFGQVLQWTQLAPTGGPPPVRAGHTAVTDPLNNMIVFAGFASGIGAPPMYNDVWVLSDADGSVSPSAWTQLTPAGALPAARARHSAVYDPNTNSMTIFGGDLSIGNCSAQSNDVWVLANANGLGGPPTWTQLTPAGALPTVREGHTAVYDGANNRMIVLGGEMLGCPFDPNAEIWVLDNANGTGGTPSWTQLSPVAGAAPDARAWHSAIYDSTNNRMIIFGGYTSTGPQNDVWVLANANGLGGEPTWTQLMPAAPLPPVRSNHSAVYDPSANAMTIFGGGTSSGLADDVWVLANANGLGGPPTWTQQQPTGAPPVPRDLHSAVLNLSTDRMTVFGGLDTAASGLNDTWVLALNATTNSLVSSLNPSTFGQSVTLTATVTSTGGGTPTGTVTFTADGSNVLGTISLSGGQAALNTSALGTGSHSIVASYVGDSTHQPSVSTALTQTVQMSGTTLGLASNINPSVYNQAVTFTALVTPKFGGSATGTVTFKDGANTLGTAAVSGNLATMTVSTLAVGTHSITAAYSGDSNFTGSSSGVVSQVVTKASTATVVASSLNPAFVTQTITYTATVTSQYGGMVSGSVVFKSGGASLGSATLVNGQASVNASFSTSGNRSITATYVGDANNTGSTSPALKQVVNKFTTSTSVTSSLNPSLVGQSVTFTATVSSAYGAIPDGEMVTFKDHSATLSTATLSGGMATLSISTLAAGSHSITVTYAGDTLFAGSVSAVLAQVVNKNPSSTTVASSLNPSSFEQMVTFTATVTTSGSPTGTVTFKSGTATLGTVALTGNTASLSTSALTAGSHLITATYNGDATFKASTSPGLKQVVSKALTAESLASSQNPSALGQPVTFTASVSSSAGVPTGTVTFKKGTTTLGTAALSGGVATFTTSTLAAGSSTITADYGGAANYSTSSASVTQVVQ